MQKHRASESSNSSSSCCGTSSPHKLLHQQRQRDTTYTKIFVGGLAYHTADRSLRQYFQQFGELEEAVVITDRQTSKSRGYGFVTMKRAEDAFRAIQEANPCIDGRKTNVNLAAIGAKPRCIPSAHQQALTIARLQTTGLYQSLPSAFSAYYPLLTGSAAAPPVSMATGHQLAAAAAAAAAAATAAAAFNPVSGGPLCYWPHQDLQTAADCSGTALQLLQSPGFAPQYYAISLPQYPSPPQPIQPPPSCPIVSAAAFLQHQHQQQLDPRQ